MLPSSRGGRLSTSGVSFMAQLYRFAFRWSLSEKLRPISEAVEAFNVDGLE